MERKRESKRITMYSPRGGGSKARETRREHIVEENAMSKAGKSRGECRIKGNEESKGGHSQRDGKERKVEGN